MALIGYWTQELLIQVIHSKSSWCSSVRELPIFLSRAMFVLWRRFGAPAFSFSDSLLQANYFCWEELEVVLLLPTQLPPECSSLARMAAAAHRGTLSSSAVAAESTSALEERSSDSTTKLWGCVERKAGFLLRLAWLYFSSKETANARVIENNTTRTRCHGGGCQTYCNPPCSKPLFPSSNLVQRLA